MKETYTCSHKLTVPGIYVNEGTIEGNEGTGSKTSNKVEVAVNEPKFTIEKEQKLEGEAGLHEVETEGDVGETVDYKIIVKNTGNAA